MLLVALHFMCGAPCMQGVIEDSGFPYNASDTVPSWTLQSIVWLVPTITIIVFGFLHLLTPLQAHQHVMNFLIMYALTGVLTNCVKLQVRSSGSVSGSSCDGCLRCLRCMHVHTCSCLCLPAYHCDSL